ncbi:MAG: hypothetical protein KC591_14040, partial [Gemmatimonadetes bacterium]|nr:hypothetical protein [Gemmatimonadota bacterium]
DAQVGDWSHIFGRGLALSVFEEEELNWDTRLDGARAELHGKVGDATLLAGTNEGNRFRGLFLEPNTWSSSNGLIDARAGVSFVEAWGAERNTDIGPREQHAGALGEVVVGPATFYGEYVERDFVGKDGVGAASPGHGTFASGEVSLEGFSFAAEFREMLRFEHNYHDPPTTLRQHTWTLLNRVNGTVLSDIPDDDVQGGLFTAEYAVDAFTTFQASWARLIQDRGDDEFFELFAEAKSNWQEQVFGTLAAAESELHIGNTFEERITKLGEAIFHLNEQNSASFIVEWADVQESNAATQAFEYPKEYRDRIFALTWGRSPWLTVTATVEDTTEDDPAEDKERWFNVLAELNLGGNDVSVSLGSERGGWKCTGGVCFYEPEFEGLKVKWTGRF